MVGIVATNGVVVNLKVNEKEEGIVPNEGNDPNYAYPPTTS